MTTTPGDVAANFGKDLFAGLAGTAAMTVSSTLEMKISGRAASETPAQAAEKALDVEPNDEDSEARFSNPVHWGYGTGWGGMRGLLDSAGLPGPAATLAHLGLVWGGEQVVLPALNVSAPVFRYGGKVVATDLWHHVVYATATRLRVPGPEPEPLAGAVATDTAVGCIFRAIFRAILAAVLAAGVCRGRTRVTRA